MRILIVNDDGICGIGLKHLAEELAQKHSVVVVAPAKEHSGTSHSISINKHLTLNDTDVIDGVKEAYVLNGSPIDCVKFGVDIIMKDNPPDVVLSGINNQMNIGTDIIYSGTVNASLEAAIIGHKSIAFSAITTDSYRDIAKFASDNLELLMGMIDNHRTIISVNFPVSDISKAKGIEFCCIGEQKYNDRYVLRKTSDHEGYILIGEPIPVPNNPPKCDVELIKKGYITISPVKWDYNDYEALSNTKLPKFIL